MPDTIPLLRALKTKFGDDQKALAHCERYHRAVNSMRPYWPHVVRNFVDIGSGSGGIAALVAHAFPAARATLIDAAQQRDKWTSYREDGQPWACVGDAAQLVENVSGCETVAVSPPVASLPPSELIYSICSWGHHYPIETYLDVVREALMPRGVLIVDLRKGEVGFHGWHVLSQHFQCRAAGIYEGKKYFRHVFEARP